MTSLADNSCEVSNDMEIREELRGQLELLRTLYCDLHQIPELAFTERETQAYLRRFLETLAPDSLYTVAGTGLKAVFYTPEARDTVAIRSDMDALPMVEESGVPYASRHQGIMHSCGHDAHMAMTLLAAKYVSVHRKRLTRNAVFIFQPGEEGAAGALEMIRCGVLEKPHIDRIYGMHVFPQLPVGQIGLHSGAFFARSFGFDIVVKGKCAHAARPDLGVDAIAAAAQLVTMLYEMRSRMISPAEQVVLHIGSIHGGSRRNVVCDEVRLQCTLRTLSDETHDRVVDQLHRILSGVSQVTGAALSMESTQDYPVVYNDPELRQEYAGCVEGCVQEMESQMIGEDFAYYQQHRKSVFALLGIGDAPPLHSPDFRLDVEALLYGVETIIRVLFRENTKNNKNGK